MAKLAAQLRDTFFGLVGRITSCGRARKDAAGVIEPKSAAPSQRTEIRSRGGAPPTNPGSRDSHN